jgi:hypothetical protein
MQIKPLPIFYFILRIFGLACYSKFTPPSLHFFIIFAGQALECDSPTQSFLKKTFKVLSAKKVKNNSRNNGKVLNNPVLSITESVINQIK